MEVAYTIGGGGLHVKNYQMEASAINTGVPVLSDGDTANTSGVIPATITSALNCIGVSVDTNRAASTLAQVTSGAGDRSDGNNASFVKVCINPDAVYRAKLSGGTTEDTALAVITQAAADTAGTAPGGGTPAVTDEAVVWGYTGANIGHWRMSDAANSVLLAFPNDIAAGDEFLEALIFIGSPDEAPTLTAAFTQVNAATASAGNNNFIIVEWEIRDAGGDGRTNSYALMLAQDHVFGNPGIVA
jgi:hypothetical protein